jgi:xanthosine utilization system XapX-like protein
MSLSVSVKCSLWVAWVGLVGISVGEQAGGGGVAIDKKQNKTLPRLLSHRTVETLQTAKEKRERGDIRESMPGNI